MRDGSSTGGTPTEPSAEATLLAAAQRHLLGNYRPAPCVITRGEGCVVWDTEGRRYLDFCAGVAVCCLGHAHPALTGALAEQAGRLVHISNYFYNDQNVHLAEELCALTGFDRVFFCNSGTEANEALLKLARRHHYEAGRPSRTRVVAFERSFHGRTLGALALTGNPSYHQGFGEPLAGVTHVPYGDLAAVEAALTAKHPGAEDVAAILVEPLLGEGGVVPPPEGFLAGLRRLTDRTGVLLLADEIQTGMGRTGRLLGMQHAGVVPDAMSLAKGLGGGFPIGAVLVGEPLAGALPPGSHGSTFGGNPLASAAARTVVRVLREEGLVERAAARGAYLGARLEDLAQRHPTMTLGTRGLGLLRALVLQPGLAARDLLGPLRERGVLLTAAGADALRFTPPLIVTESEIDEACQRVDDTLAGLAG